MVQIVVSVVVLALFARDVDTGSLRDALGRASPGWLVLAILLNAGAQILHDARVWIAFRAPRPPFARVVAIGLAGNLLNLVLPARAGDVVAITLLHKECEVSPGRATAAVGVVGFLEAAAFGLLLVVVLTIGATHWQEVLGEAAHGRALHFVTALTLTGVVIAVVGVLGARLLFPPADPGGPHPAANDNGGLIGMVRDTTHELSDQLGTPANLAANLSTAGLQVALMVWVFTLALPAVGLDPPFPWLVASGVLALSSLSSVVLPPAYGAGPAAASVAVLAVFGVDQAGALAYAGAWWLTSQVPAVALGLPALWGRAAAVSAALQRRP